MTLNQILAMIPGNNYKTKFAAVGLALVGLAKALVVLGTFLVGDVNVIDFLPQMQASLSSLATVFETLLGVGLWHKFRKDQL